MDADNVKKNSDKKIKAKLKKISLGSLRSFSKNRLIGNHQLLSKPVFGFSLVFPQIFQAHKTLAILF